MQRTQAKKSRRKIKRQRVQRLLAMTLHSATALHAGLRASRMALMKYRWCVRGLISSAMSQASNFAIGSSQDSERCRQPRMLTLMHAVSGRWSPATSLFGEWCLRQINLVPTATTCPLVGLNEALKSALEASRALVGKDRRAFPTHPLRHSNLAPENIPWRPTMEFLHYARKWHSMATSLHHVEMCHHQPSSVLDSCCLHPVILCRTHCTCRTTAKEPVSGGVVDVKLAAVTIRS
mmetsp:Transcript_21951/g.57302  ORF Transcript_21951/g.57302 Transcript_21951/m.57302 type:complete len:235 (+) Transcript_21951:2794-3498(+)